MHIENEAERQAAATTLKEVMGKLEEALRLARKLEEEAAQRRERVGACSSDG
jgi:hypothetical protein